MNTFSIKNLENVEFRIKDNISPVDILALSMQDFEKFEQLRVIYKFALEHTEVKIGEQWVPVKTVDKEVYMPMGINSNGLALQELASYFIQEVIGKTFTKSSESA